MMKLSKFITLIGIVLLGAANFAAQIKPSPKTKIEPPKTITPCEESATALTDPANAENKMKIIAEGSSDKVTAPFVYVARSAASLENLRSLVAEFPAVGEIDFSKTAIVAAFAGEKRTGGYAVKIEQTGAAISVAEIAPPPNAITTDALTYPYQIALVPNDNDALDINIPAAWKQSAENYKITDGTIDYAGGIAGIMKKQPIAGQIKILTAGDAITLIFDVTGKADADKGKKLTQIVSGKLSGGKIVIERLDVGDFSQGPKPPDAVAGTLADGKLNLILTPLPTNIRDGFSAEGKISAERSENK